MIVRVNGAPVGPTFSHPPLGTLPDTVPTLAQMAYIQGTVQFTAADNSTLLEFVSTDPTHSSRGIVLDAVTVFADLGPCRRRRPRTTSRSAHRAPARCPSTRAAQPDVCPCRTSSADTGSIGPAASVAPVGQGVTVSVPPTVSAGTNPRGP